MNKNLQSLEEKMNNIEDKSKSISNINCTQEEISDYKKINCPLSQQNIRKISIRNIQNFKNNSTLFSMQNFKKALFQNNNENKKTFNSKKLLLRNMSATNIEINSHMNNKKNLASYCNNKNNSINESMSNYLYKINESEFNNISKDLTFNDKRNNNNSHININNKLKLKLPVNITNNNYNMNKNNVMINLSTNIVSDNLNLEKLKVQQKLVEYRKLIDQKINELMYKKRNSNSNNKHFNHKNKARRISPKTNALHKNASMPSLNSDCENKSKKKGINNNANKKFLNNENTSKNKNEKNLIIPKKIKKYDDNKIAVNKFQRNVKLKHFNKNKLNILTKKVDENNNFNIKNFEDEKDNNFYNQITSKGLDEDKSEDTKK